MLLCHEAFLLSNTKFAVLKHEIVIFKYEKCVFFKYKNVSLSNTKNASFSNTKMCHFQIQKMSLFQIRECAIFKFEKRTVIKYKKCGLYVFSNTCYFFQQTARHTNQSPLKRVVIS